MIDRTIIESDIIEINKLIKSKHLSAKEVTQTCINLAEKCQPNLNCFISLEVEDALTQAQNLDKKISKGEDIGPLGGIPLAHKDMYYRKGQISTCGSKIRKNWKANTTATVLTKLDQAGFINMGTLNMAEFATGATGHNEHWGHCRNPWNNQYITGGSSSGSGSAVGSRSIFGSLGSDTGGSVRLPATACGVVGLKPTHGLISRYGIMPLSYSMDTVGPLTRNVKDNARITDIIKGYDQKDTTTINRTTDSYEMQCGLDIKGMRIGVPRNYYFEIASDEIKEKINSVLKIFEGLGGDIIEVTLPDMHQITHLSNIVFPSEACAIHANWLRDCRDDYQPQVRTRYEPGLHIPANKYLRALDMRPYLLREYIEKGLNNVDVLILPGMPFEVPKIDETNVAASPKMAETIASISWCTRPTNYLGVPSLSVPCGFTSNGLPTAFQITGRPFSEGTLYRFAHTYQEVTTWHKELPNSLSN